MNTRTRTLAALIALGTGLTLAVAPGYAATPAKVGHSHFALTMSGYGTRIIGGQVPGGSQTTAYQRIGCTNKVNKAKNNDVASATIPGLGGLSGLHTRVWTTRHHGVVGSNASHSVDSLTLASTPLGTLSINAINATARAYHDATGFHATTTTSSGSITLTPPAPPPPLPPLPPQTFPLPTPGQPVTIPGLATIYAGKNTRHSSATGAFANAVALIVDVTATGTQAKVGRAVAQIGSGLTYGMFHGHSNATRISTALQGNLKSGPNPLSLMPCQGTAGAVRSKALASLDLGGQLVVNGLGSSERGVQTDTQANGYERGEVAQVNLGSGALVVNGIVGQANVKRTAHKIVRSAKGTTVGTITANGQTMRFPSTGVLEIPGVAKLERRLITKTQTGLTVVALRITLLGGTGGVIDLGEAKLRISKLQH
jgi:hypothetical protein